MIRLIFLLRRRPELSLAEFQRYWREQHGPLVASHAQRIGALRYIQVHRLDDGINARLAEMRGGMEEPYDGVAELWWDSEEALAAVQDTEGGRAAGEALLEDERKFIDLPNSPLWFAHEYPQVNPTPENIVARERNSIVKLYFPLRRRSELTEDAAQRYWRTSHGPLIRSQAQAGGILRYQQVHRFESAFEEDLRASRGTATPPYTGHAEVWFDRGAPRTGPEAAASSARAIEDESKFIDFKRSCMWIGKEHVFIDRM
ncbi:MAG TPA: EthD domain-containing protein [Pseudomonadales bacterium]|nr:EthD domain-containing protein [Pseudomonadales bacterium]